MSESRSSRDEFYAVLATQRETRHQRRLKKAKNRNLVVALAFVFGALSLISYIVLGLLFTIGTP
jgi:hypothetical protein